MEASLAVPTATSQRRIPVKLLDENRRIINRHLQDRGRRKASFTHLIAYAILRALEQFPQMNDGFEVVDGQPSRIKRAAVNLGIACGVSTAEGLRKIFREFFPDQELPAAAEVRLGDLARAIGSRSTP